MSTDIKTQTESITELDKYLSSVELANYFLPTSIDLTAVQFVNIPSTAKKNYALHYIADYIETVQVNGLVGHKIDNIHEKIKQHKLGKTQTKSYATNITWHFVSNHIKVARITKLKTTKRGTDREWGAFLDVQQSILSLYNTLSQFKRSYKFDGYTLIQKIDFVSNEEARHHIHTARLHDKKSMFTNRNYEIERRLTFASTNISTQAVNQLALCGFYFNDTIKCNYCKLELLNYNGTEPPLMIHKMLSPNCPLLFNRPTDNVPINARIFYTQVSADMVYDEFGSEQPLEHKKPQYEDVEERLKTFKNWQYQRIQDANRLAQAGYIYTGHADSVECFSCGLIIGEWEKNDDPKIEHRKHHKGPCKYNVVY